MASSLDLEEQEQLEALKHFWKAWGTLISSVLIVVLLAIGAWNIWSWWQNRQAANASLLYQSLLSSTLSDNTDVVQQAFEDLKNHYGSTTYASQGALIAAKTLIEKGKVAQGKAALEWAAKNGSNPGLQSVARLNLSTVFIGEKNYDQALSQLTWTFPAAFAPLAADRRGDILLAQGKRDGAITEYGKAFQGFESSGQDYRKLVFVKLAALGIDAVAGERALNDTAAKPASAAAPTTTPAAVTPSTPSPAGNPRGAAK